MQTVYGLENLHPAWQGSTVCIGVFDGVHIGHQAVIKSAVNDAHEHNRPCIVLTFDKNPAALLRPDRCPRSILPPSMKLAKLQACGADIIAIATFDQPFAHLSPEEFVQQVLHDGLRANQVVVGHDFAFGRDRVGKPDWLATVLPTKVIPPFEINGRRVSSTEIRRDIEHGLVSEAEELLGSSYALSGIVIEGQKLAREWGMPTANLAPIFDQVIPGIGIYAGHATVAGTRYQAAISVGMRPAVPGAGFAIEAHMLNAPRLEIYGRELTLEFQTRIRDEKSFDSEPELVEQMKLDVESVRQLL